MPADVQAGVFRQRQIVQILRRQALCRNLVHPGQIEILPPADDGIIGSAHRHKPCIIRQADRQCGKLHLLFLANLVDVSAKLQVTVARRIRHLTEQRNDFPRHDKSQRALILGIVREENTPSPPP